MWGTGRGAAGRGGAEQGPLLLCHLVSPPTTPALLLPSDKLPFGSGSILSLRSKLLDTFCSVDKDKRLRSVRSGSCS